MVIKYIYTVFLGLLIAIFVGVGISVFYETPKEPNCFETISYISEKEPTEQDRLAERACEKQYQQYEEEKLQPYSLNVSIIALVFSILLLGVSFAISEKAKVVADGVMLGGVFTLIYSLARSFGSANNKFSFAIVTISLIVVIFIGYTRFVKPQHHPKTEK